MNFQTDVVSFSGQRYTDFFGRLTLPDLQTGVTAAVDNEQPAPLTTLIQLKSSFLAKKMLIEVYVRSLAKRVNRRHQCTESFTMSWI